MKTITSLILLIVLLTGCTEPTIDTSTDDSMRITIEEVRDSLEVEKQKEFDDAMQIIMFSKINMSGIFVAAFTKDVPNDENMIEDLKRSIDGKTAFEIITEAKKIRERIEKE